MAAPAFVFVFAFAARPAGAANNAPPARERCEEVERPAALCYVGALLESRLLELELEIRA